MSRAGTYLALVLLGALVGAVGTFLQAARLTLAGQGNLVLPYGIVIALALTAGVCAVGGLAVESRAGALAAGAGWLAVVVLSLSPGPGGDVVLPARTLSYVWLFGGLLLVGMALTAPYELLGRRVRGRRS